jgi:hypothetical protein
MKFIDEDINIEDCKYQENDENYGNVRQKWKLCKQIHKSQHIYYIFAQSQKNINAKEVSFDKHNNLRMTINGLISQKWKQKGKPKSENIIKHSIKSSQTHFSMSLIFDSYNKACIKIDT